MSLETVADTLPEFARNSEIQEAEWDQAKIGSHRVLVVGANPTSEAIITQLLVLGYKDIHLWSNERQNDSPKAVELLKRLNHISPYYRHRTEYGSLESKAITANFDVLGFRQFKHIDPTILINTLNNQFISDTLLARFLDQREENGLYIDAHTVQQHEKRLYGLNVQAALRLRFPTYDEHRYIEQRDLSVFEGQEHDPLMAIIAASYTSALAIRHTLKHQSSPDTLFFKQPVSLTLFPFSKNPLEVAPANKQIHYEGFFGNKGIYVAGLGGGSLILDTLIRLFDVNWIRGVDRDKLERSNFNRLIPFIHEDLIGKQKTEAASTVYDDIVGRKEKDYKFIDGVIFDDLLIGKDKYKIDIIFGMLSGHHNKLNLVALSQQLAQEKEHLLTDTGVEPFRFDITNYLAGRTPCDHCRNLHDIAVTEYLADDIPNCDRYPTGSTVFANYLGVLSIIEAMKYVDPALGSIVTGSISGNLLTDSFDPEIMYSAKESVPVDATCLAHQRTSPLIIKPSDYRIEDGFDIGWQTKEIYEKEGRHIGSFRYGRKSK